MTVTDRDVRDGTSKRGRVRRRTCLRLAASAMIVGHDDPDYQVKRRDVLAAHTESTIDDDVDVLARVVATFRALEDDRLVTSSSGDAEGLPCPVFALTASGWAIVGPR